MSVRLRIGSLTLAAVAVLLLSAGSAAAAQGPWWHFSTRLSPANIKPEGEGTVIVQALNVGDGETAGPIVLSDTIPAGFTLEGVEFFGPGNLETYGNRTDIGPGNEELAFLELCRVAGNRATCSTETQALHFEYLPPIIPYETLEMRLRVKAEPGPVSGPSEASVSGGSAPTADSDRSLQVDEDGFRFAAENYELTPEEEGGAIDTRAGSHPFQLTASFAFEQASEPAKPPLLARNLHFNLPPGQIGNPSALPQCSSLDFSQLTEGGFANLCPSASAIGVVSLRLFQLVGEEEGLTVPLFNLTPGPGEPARFGFEAAGIPVILDTALRSGPGADYGITVDVSNITQIAMLASSTLTFWGAPGDSRHDASRGWGCVSGDKFAEATGQECRLTREPKPAAFLTLPTNCSQPYSTSVEGSSWPTQNAPGGNALLGRTYTLGDSRANPLAISACNQVPFAPVIAAEATSRFAESPSGLKFELNFDDEGLGSAQGVAESQLKKAVVALPKGVTTNPAVASGLLGCSFAQLNEENLTNQAGCPEASKIGEVEIESPLVEPTIDGSIYVAKQNDNGFPNPSLLAIYMVAKNPELGVLVRTEGRVEPQSDGQLITTFDDLPQLPFSHFELSFRSDPRAPLITPATCGEYKTAAALYPYSNPAVPVQRTAAFTVEAGANGATCASSESQLPNNPRLQAGSASPIAGAYSPFDFEVSREDGSQQLRSIEATLPKGLLGRLAGIPYCSEAQIAAAQARAGEGQGALELASPSCPAASEVGTVSAGAGAGSQPYYVSGKAYLAGPYKGAPLSLEIVTPAIAGPFDLGVVAVRTALYVNDETTQITAKSDPIPSILHGLPLDVRSIDLNMNRPSFTLNPTSCNPMAVTGNATSTLGNVAPLSRRFQVGACNALNFAPKLALNLKGGIRRNRNPALTATLTYPKGSYANIAKAQVTLPHSEFLDQAHIKTVCTRVQFAAGAGNGAECPKASIYGKAMATTPLLDKPVSGPVYLRSSSNKLPDLVAALNGQIDVVLDGRIDTGKGGGIRNTFQAVPDAPVSKFVLSLQGGKKGLLVNSENICAKKAKTTAIADFTAQNGKVHDTNPKVTNSCGSGEKGKKK